MAGILDFVKQRRPDIMSSLRFGIDAAATPNRTASTGANVMGGLSNAFNQQDVRLQQGYENTLAQVEQKRLRDKAQQDWQKHLDELREKQTKRRQDASQFERTADQQDTRIGYEGDRIDQSEDDAYSAAIQWYRENKLQPPTREEWNATREGDLTPTFRSIPMYARTEEERLSIDKDKALIANTEARTDKALADINKLNKEIDNFENEWNLNKRNVESQIAARSAGAARDLAEANSLGRPGDSSLTQNQSEELTGLRKELQGLDAYKSYIGTSKSIQTVLGAIKQANDAMAAGTNEGFPDVTAINSFQRMIDEGVSVREADVKLLEEARGLYDYLKNIGGQIAAGRRLGPEIREKMANLTMDIYKSSVENLKDSTQPIRNTALDRGYSPDQVDRYLYPNTVRTTERINKKMPFERPDQPQGRTRENNFGFSQEQIDQAAKDGGFPSNEAYLDALEKHYQNAR